MGEGGHRVEGDVNPRGRFSTDELLQGFLSVFCARIEHMFEPADASTAAEDGSTPCFSQAPGAGLAGTLAEADPKSLESDALVQLIAGCERLAVTRPARRPVTRPARTTAMLPDLERSAGSAVTARSPGQRGSRTGPRPQEATARTTHTDECGHRVTTSTILRKTLSHLC